MTPLTHPCSHRVCVVITTSHMCRWAWADEPALPGGQWLSRTCCPLSGPESLLVLWADIFTTFH